MQGVFSVMALGPGDMVEQRLVTPAERVGPLWAITSGLKPGDRVITEGLQKVRPGMKVNATTVLIEDEKEMPEKSAEDGKPAPSTPPAAEKPHSSPPKEPAGEKKSE
jgi:hypothetical protein